MYNKNDDNKIEIADWVNDNNYRKRTEEMNIQGGTVKNIQTNRLRRSDKKKVNRIKQKVVIGVASLIVISGLFVGGTKLFTPKEEFKGTLPYGYVVQYVTEPIERNDNLLSIASEYYCDIYDQMYGSKENFVEAIKTENNLNYRGDIKFGDYLKIPALVEENNIDLVQMAEIKAQIAEIEKNEYWVEYTVKMGDSLLGLAAKASGSTNETYQLKDKIMSKNSLRSTNIYENQKLYIVNPTLGPLKLQIEELRESLYESLKVEQTTK